MSGMEIKRGPVTYREPAEFETSELCPLQIGQRVTVPLGEEGTFEYAVREMLGRLIHGFRFGYRGDILVTTHWCLSGYSEYTITNEWQEVTLSVPGKDLEVHFAGLPSLFKELAKVDDGRPY